MRRVFTEHFAGLGYAADVAFPFGDYDTENPSLLNADLLIDDGCPVLKRRPFFQWPPYLDDLAVIGRWTLDKVDCVRLSDGSHLAEPRTECRRRRT